MTPFKQVRRIALKAVGLGSAGLGTAEGGEYVFSSASHLYHKYWGSRWACVNVEREDLSDYEHLIDPGYLKDEEYKSLGAAREQSGGESWDIGLLAKVALKNDELFKLCLANHYLTRWEEKVELARYIESFDPFSNIESKKQDQIYLQFKRIFYRRFLYHKEKLIREQTDRSVARYVTSMFTRLMDKEDALNQCVFQPTEPLFDWCMVGLY